MPREPISAKLRYDVLMRDGFRCVYCGRTAGEVTLEIDHIEPVSKGGKTILANLQASCRDCNRGKEAKDIIVNEHTGGLVGKFFHTFIPKDALNYPGKIQWQGRILDDLGDGYYLIELFEWLSGGRDFYGTKIVHVSRIAAEEWSLYPDSETMQEAYQYGGRAILRPDKPAR